MEGLEKALLSGDTVKGHLLIPIKKQLVGTIWFPGLTELGVDFLERQTTVKSVGETVTMMVWDTAGIRLNISIICSGQEEFDAVTRGYYRGRQLIS